MNEQVYDRLRLGLNVRRLRHGMRLTQGELAARIGCGNRLISAIERGQRDISVEMLFALCRALECPVQELLLGV